MTSVALSPLFSRAGRALFKVACLSWNWADHAGLRTVSHWMPKGNNTKTTFGMWTTEDLGM